MNGVDGPSVPVNPTEEAAESDAMSSETFLTDEELTELALAADPAPPLDRNVLPWSPYTDQDSYALPDWYMPRARGLRRGRTSKVVVISLIVGFLVIDAFGLCITSGILTFA